MGIGWVVGVPGSGRETKVVVLRGTVVEIIVGGATAWRTVVVLGFAQIGTLLPGTRVGARVVVVKRVLI